MRIFVITAFALATDIFFEFPFVVQCVYEHCLCIMFILSFQFAHNLYVGLFLQNVLLLEILVFIELS